MAELLHSTHKLLPDVTSTRHLFHHAADHTDDSRRHPALIMCITWQACKHPCGIYASVSPFSHLGATCAMFTSCVLYTGSPDTSIPAPFASLRGANPDRIEQVHTSTDRAPSKQYTDASEGLSHRILELRRSQLKKWNVELPAQERGSRIKARDQECTSWKNTSATDA